jgi:hypothetical protein
MYSTLKLQEFAMRAGQPLTARQEAFCLAYLTVPYGARAAIIAGYAPSGARVEASRLLTNANIVARIAELRGEIAKHHCANAEAALVKLEAICARAMEQGHYYTAVRAVELQARIAGLLSPRAETPAPAAPEPAASADEDGKAAVTPETTGDETDDGPDDTTAQAAAAPPDPEPASEIPPPPTGAAPPARPTRPKPAGRTPSAAARRRKSRKTAPNAASPATESPGPAPETRPAPEKRAALE